MMRFMDAMLTAEVSIENVSEWCRVNGVDRRTFYRHRARIRAEGQWQRRSTRPRTTPHATPEPVVAEIVRLREALAPENGADPIRDRLLDLAGPCHDNRVSRGWTKIGSSLAIQEGPFCDGEHISPGRLVVG